MSYGRWLLIWRTAFPKWLALAAAAFLLFANLDNVPDCPELLNAPSKSVLSNPSVHSHIPPGPAALLVSRIGPSRSSLGARIAPAPSRIAPLLHFASICRASDPSPPFA